MNYIEKAATYFSNGFNCAQAVLAAFAPDFNVDEELALKLTSSFGGGARCGQLCGAVSGALMVLGLKYGYHCTEDKEQVNESLKMTLEFQKLFSERNNSLVCKDLLGYDLSDSAQKKEAKEKGLFKEICPRMVSSAVEIVEQLLSSETA